ncbi:MAG: Flp pilus assembly complex ATPase component TadA [Planctomycetes bacterium]|nr:Flp pilus assembly complex ATPase component TadA [Planctomycetota bacterium]
MIFGRRKGRKTDSDSDDSDDDEKIEYVLFQGALNGKEANLKENARLARAGLIPSKHLLTDSLERRAETIRIDPKEGGAIISLFIDGVRNPGGRMPKQRVLAISHILKLLAGLDIRQRQKPQSGGIRAEFQGTPYELYVESTPVAGGMERITIRVQNMNRLLETPDELGFPEEMRSKIREMTSQKNGSVLVCGPKHSGTSTTLMGVMRCVDAYMYSIYSIADLGKRDLIHVKQFEANPGDSLKETITRVIREETDVLFLDPIRDSETAKTVFQMQKRISMLSEFTARDTVDGLLQVINWVDDAKVVAEGLRGIVSQKLVRLLCTDCKEAFRPHRKLIEKVGLPASTQVLFRPPRIPPEEEIAEEDIEPCGTCGGIGYLGRTGMYEFLEISDAIREQITSDPTVDSIKAIIRNEGMQTLQKDGLRLVAEGKTSLEELQRVFRSA